MRWFQFMDFWLSFMAVVSTFVYLAAIDEGSRRTIQTAASILTALMAATEATRYEELTSLARVCLGYCDGLLTIC